MTSSARPVNQKYPSVVSHRAVARHVPVAAKCARCLVGLLPVLREQRRRPSLQRDVAFDTRARRMAVLVDHVDVVTRRR